MILVLQCIKYKIGKEWSVRKHLKKRRLLADSGIPLDERKMLDRPSNKSLGQDDIATDSNKSVGEDVIASR